MTIEATSPQDSISERTLIPILDATDVARVSEDALRAAGEMLRALETLPLDDVSVERVLAAWDDIAIVLENGTSRAALITVDAGSIPDATWQAVTQRLQAELGIPPAQVLLTATHTHSAGGLGGPGYIDGIVESVRAAQKALTPARVGYGTGVSHINVNRQIIDPATGRWWEGANYDGPSDKTVAVVTFTRPTGEPLAVYYNYGVHAVVTGQLDLISADDA